MMAFSSMFSRIIRSSPHLRQVTRVSFANGCLASRTTGKGSVCNRIIFPVTSAATICIATTTPIATTTYSKPEGLSDVKPATFDAYYDILTLRVHEGNTDASKMPDKLEVRRLLFLMKSPQELEKAKELLKSYRASNPAAELLRSKDVTRVCIECSIPYQALEILTNPDLYGIEITRPSCRWILTSFAFHGDVDGVLKVTELMKKMKFAVGGFEKHQLIRASTRSFITAVEDEKTTPTLESLQPILKLCADGRAPSGDHGNASAGFGQEHYFEKHNYLHVNGTLLQHKLYELSAGVLDTLEAEGVLKVKLLVDMRIDYLLVKEDLQGVIEKLRQVIAAGYTLKSMGRRFHRYREIFEKCDDPELLQAFNNL